jgi:hypothetical protein
LAPAVRPPVSVRARAAAPMTRGRILLVLVMAAT